MPESRHHEPDQPAKLKRHIDQPTALRPSLTRGARRSLEPARGQLFLRYPILFGSVPEVVREQVQILEAQPPIPTFSSGRDLTARALPPGTPLDLLSY
jgi:hypothetical protein